MDTKIHFLKRISGWHYVYVILILILTIVGIVAYFYSHSAWHGVLLRIDRPLRCIYLK